MEKKYYKSLDILRILSCIFVFLYHLGILKGGYLAVCTFFVLTSYLSCMKAFRTEKMNLLKYYKERFIHIYIPFLFVVLLTVFAFSLTDASWLNLKPETTSSLLGYNNFWQLGANLDYFTRSMSSPFMHFWYIAILFQFDLIFPFIYMLFNKIGKKVSKLATLELLAIFSIISMIYFYRVSEIENIMVVYYDTFSRCFSLVLGLTVGFIHNYFKPLVPRFVKKNYLSSFIFFIYLGVLTFMMFTVGADDTMFNVAMLASSLITCRLIDYGSVIFLKKNQLLDKFFRYISGITYEIYLFQYPVIFITDIYLVNEGIKMPVVIILTILLSIILHFALSKKKYNKPVLVLKYLTLVIIVALSILGAKEYVFAKDNSEEMHRLEEQLSQNEKMLKQKQEEYLKKKQEEEEKWTSMLKEMENGEEKLKEIVTNLPIVGIGDSVLLGASPTLYETFPNGYFDGKVSRTDYELNPILLDLKSKGMLSDIVLINLGTNGDCKMKCKPQIIETLKDKKVFWVNVTNDYQVHVNSRIESIANDNDNIYLVDWVEASKNHKEYFVADGIHLTGSGRRAYAKTVYDTIYNVYLDEFNKTKEELLKKHEEDEKTKITFIGNDILINAFNMLSDNFTNSKFITKSNYTFDTLLEDLKSAVEKNELTHKIVFAFDSSIKLSKDKYRELLKVCKDHEIYLLLTDSSIKNIDNVTEIKFYEEINNNLDYLMVDRIHLTEKGNMALINTLSKALNISVDESNVINN